MNPIFIPILLAGVFLALGLAFGLAMAVAAFREAYALAGQGRGSGRERQPLFRPKQLLALVLFPPYTLLAIGALALGLVRSVVNLAVLIIELVFDLLGMFTAMVGQATLNPNAAARFRHFAAELRTDLDRTIGELLRPLGVLLSYAGFGGVVTRIARRFRRRSELRLAPPPPLENGAPPPAGPLVCPFAERYQVVKTLPGAGSSAELFVVRRLEQGQPQGELLLLKSFDLARGAWLENLVRESEGMKLAKRVGLVVDYMFGDDYFYYVMPYHQGETLAQGVVRIFSTCAANAGLPAPELRRTLGWVREVALEVQRFHQAGLIHKDIKPENVILTKAGAKLIDLGLVTQMSSALTLTTHGTEYFRDPELVRLAIAGKKVNEVDAACFDIYALGALLYFALEGTFPATGPFSGYQRPVPYAATAIANKAMSDFEKRYRSVAELLEDLEALLAARKLVNVKPAKLPSFRAERRARPHSGLASLAHPL